MASVGSSTVAMIKVFSMGEPEMAHDSCILRSASLVGRCRIRFIGALVTDRMAEGTADQGLATLELRVARCWESLQIQQHLWGHLKCTREWATSFFRFWGLVVWSA